MTQPDSPPETFSRALQSLRAARLRPEITCDEAPAPQRLAPFSVALTADVVVGEDELGSGRFVVLHNPDGHEAWDGTFRIVTFARAALDVSMGADPLVTQVGWSWLMECLDAHDLDVVAASGTVTRVASESFGVDVGPSRLRRAGDPGVLDAGDRLARRAPARLGRPALHCCRAPTRSPPASSHSAAADGTSAALRLVRSSPLPGSDLWARFPYSPRR